MNKYVYIYILSIWYHLRLCPWSSLQIYLPIENVCHILSHAFLTISVPNHCLSKIPHCQCPVNPGLKRTEPAQNCGNRSRKIAHRINLMVLVQDHKREEIGGQEKTKLDFILWGGRNGENVWKKDKELLAEMSQIGWPSQVPTSLVQELFWN